MSAFEADRFNRSRTSPENSCQLLVSSSQLKPRFLVSLGMTSDGKPELATVSEKLLQDFCAASCQHAATDFHAMVQLRMIQHLHHRMNRACFRIRCAINQALDPGMHHRTCAHRARFNCNKQVAAGQTMVTDGCTGLAQGDDLGVGGGVEIRDVAIPPAAHDAPLADRKSTRLDSSHLG